MTIGVLTLAPILHLGRAVVWPHWTTGQKIPMQLKRGAFVVLRYPAKLAVASACPRALIVFGSGCGGWSYWEENVCHRLQADGCEVLGIDFSLYAQSDYDQATLEIDSRAWLPLLKTTQREYDFSEAIHDYRGACPEFLNELGDSVSWILDKGTGPSARLAPQVH